MWVAGTETVARALLDYDPKSREVIIDFLTSESVRKAKILQPIEADVKKLKKEIINKIKLLKNQGNSL